MRISQDAFGALARDVLYTGRSLRRFKATFGVTPLLCSVLWNWMDDDQKLPEGASPIHLLWTLMFLKLYDTEDVLSLICRCDPKTHRKWVWLMLSAIASIDDVVSECCLCDALMIRVSS